jgi:NAD(P)H-flavin reductase/ferredoxin
VTGEPVTEFNIAAGDYTFPCQGDETVLDAAERAGLQFPYSCRKGACSSCEAQLLMGEVEARGPGRLSGPAEGVRLCQAKPLTDLVIEPQRIVAREAAPIQTLTAKVHKVLHPAPDVTVLKLRFANGVRVRFRPGQYLKVHLPDGKTRYYSIANAPHANDGAELHIRHASGGRFSGFAAGLRPGDRLTVEVAHGEGLPHAERPLILLATGTGFAPVKAILEDLVRRDGPRAVHLYWGGRTEADLYMVEQVRALAARHPWLTFTPVLSRPPDGWTGAVGHVQDLAIADHPDLSDLDVYACGNPAMTSAARGLFTAKGLDRARFYGDPFVASGETPSSSEAVGQKESSPQVAKR